MLYPLVRRLLNIFKPPFYITALPIAWAKRTCTALEDSKPHIRHIEIVESFEKSDWFKGRSEEDNMMNTGFIFTPIYI